MENFSCLLFDTLNEVGYSPDIIGIRRNFWQERAKVLNTSMTHDVGMHVITAGSKAEGITSLFHSDIDMMILFNDAVCTSDIAAVSHIPDMTVIHVETRDAPPGYTRLKLITCNGILSGGFLRECTFESESRDVYLSSALFACYCKQGLQGFDDHQLIGEIAGPAIQAGKNCDDYVIAFNCHYPELLHSWASRPRYHNWPPADVIEEASSMLAQVVPVGSKGSCDQWREWRFCFIESELKLTYSLNETQLKLYILLKMVAKDILSQVSGEISSYIMKNITYWLSELLPRVVFRKGNLFSLLVLSLKFLESSIRENCLPYYMIPGRNLLAERLTPDCRLRVSGLIDEIIQEGPQLLLRCSRIRAAFTIRVMEPAVLVKYSEARHLVEVLWFCSRLFKWYRADQSDIDAVQRRLYDIVLPEWIMLLIRGIPDEIIVGVINERVRTILS